jgi:hypothetical protein
MEVHASGTPEARKMLADLVDSWNHVKDSLSTSQYASAYGPSTFTYAKSVGSRRRPSPSEFGLSSRAVDEQDDFLDDRKLEIRNWKRDVTWTLETINEEIHALRQRYLTAPPTTLSAMSLAVPTDIASTRPTDESPNDPLDPVKRTMWSILKHLALDIAVVWFVVSAIRWIRKKPRLAEKYPPLKGIERVVGVVRYLLGLLGLDINVR